MSNILDVKSIMKLAKKHSQQPFTARDELVIALTGLAYFNATELSRMQVKDIINERTGIALDGYLPSNYGNNGFERYFFIGEKTYLRDCVERYIEWRKENAFGCVKENSYCGLNPESCFILKNDGTEFTLNYKSKDEGCDLTQPLQMQRLFKSYFLDEAITIVSLMDSFIANFWNEKSKQGTVQAIRDLMELTGLTAETLRRKCIRKQDSIQNILMGLYK
jgi:hypothetical protein